MLALALVCLASLGQNPPDRPDVFRGTVVEQGSGRPLAGVTVRVLDGFDVPTATTDAAGRFDGLPAPDSSWLPVDGQSGPPLRIRAEDDRAWPWSLAGSEGKPVRLPEPRQREVIRNVYERQVGTRWKGRGRTAELVAECPPIGVVEAVVLRPDGRPLADSPIVLAPRSGLAFMLTPTIHVAGRTDEAGAFRIRAFEGAHEFGVLVAGVGFGSTGRVDVKAGETARPVMPPLARFARIEGRLDDSLRGPGAEATLNAFPHDPTLVPFARCDDEGRFVMTDVLPGDYLIGVRRGAENVSVQGNLVRLGPGQVVRDVIVAPPPRPSPEAERERRRLMSAMNGDPNRVVAWVEGTARDDQGRPLAGATVRARQSFGAGMRLESEVGSTTTDAEGRYRIQGPARSAMGSLSVLFEAKGRPSLLARAESPNIAAEPSEHRPARLDVALGAKGGSLAIRVVRDGRKEPGARVLLTTMASSQLFGDGDERPAEVVEMKAMREAIAPTAMTGGDGIARFENLPPGFYDAIAMAADEPLRFQAMAKRAVPVRMRPARGVARGIGIASGGKVEAAVAIEPDPEPVRFRLLGPDGAPVANRAVSVAYSRSPATTTQSMVRTDDRGEGSIMLGPGLWSLDLRYGDGEPISFPLRDEPYQRAEIRVPSSPALNGSEPIVVRAVRREPGSLRVRLLDASGAPARGGVTILSRTPGGGAPRAGTADDGGWVRFNGMSSGTYRLRGAIDGTEPPPRPQAGPRRLEDAELAGREMVFDRDVVVEPDAETAVELRSEPVGYARVMVRPPAGRSGTDYLTSVASGELPGAHASFESTEDRSRYLFGPYPAGPRQLVVAAVASLRGSGTIRSESEVVVEPGAIVRAEVDAPAFLALPGRSGGIGWGRLGIGELGLNDPETGEAMVSAFEADGETPALGARALFIPAGEREPILAGSADAAGRLTWSGVSRSPRPTGRAEPEPAVEPTILAWSPGGAGPAIAILKPGEPLRVALPAPVAVVGRVTVAGAAVGGRDARIRVVLAAEGNGAVAAAMRRETFADAAGAFRFEGVAPGRHLARAVRDELWLSEAVSIVVRPGENPTAVELDVPAPGATIALDLADHRGNPITAGFSIKRSSEPIDDLPPIAGRTDERGTAVLAGLSAGLFAMEIEGDPRPHALDVPPARAGAGPLGVRVEVSRRGP